MSLNCKNNRNIFETFFYGKTENQRNQSINNNHIENENIMNNFSESVKKNEDLPKDINWHLIGKLQRNKVKYIAPFIHLIHSVDSERLLNQINREGDKNNRIINVLLQIKISNDPLKTGFEYSELGDMFSGSIFLKYKFVKIIGFMGIGSIDQSKNEKEFKKISDYFNEINKIYDLKYLSLGMSNDYKLAIKYNSNIVEEKSY